MGHTFYSLEAQLLWNVVKEMSVSSNVAVGSLVLIVASEQLLPLRVSIAPPARRRDSVHSTLTHESAHRKAEWLSFLDSTFLGSVQNGKKQ